MWIRWVVALLWNMLTDPFGHSVIEIALAIFGPLVSLLLGAWLDDLRSWVIA